MYSKPLCPSCGAPKIRKIPVSVNFLSTILGPEMAAPILWVPGISVFFLQENLHVHKIPRFFGGVFWFFFGGGGKCLFYFYGRRDFSEKTSREGGRTLRKGAFLPSKHLLSTFYKRLPSKNPSKNLFFTEYA